MKKKQRLYWSTILYSIFSGKGIYVLGYTKSGTNWLTKLLRDYSGLAIYEAWKEKNIGAGAYVHHIHRFLPFERVEKRTVYILRDGRDAFVSRYHTMVKQVTQRKEKERFAKFLGKEPTIKDITTHMPMWISYLSKDNIASIEWAKHVEKGLKTYTTKLKFEDLKNNYADSMKDVIEGLSLGPFDAKRMQSSYENNLFENIKRQKINDDYSNSFLRSGNLGDYKTVFNRESAELFCDYAGDILIKAGYEKNNNWVSEFS